MPLFNTEAIVIRSLSYGESDKIVTFFTRDFGRLKGIAKGARNSRKRFQNALGLFTHLQLAFFDREGGGLTRVDGAEILNHFPRTREHLQKILYGNYFLELIEEMSGEREVNPQAFELLLSSLQALEETDPREERLRIFEVKLLSLFGYQPSLRKCCRCQKDWEALKNGPAVFFSLEKGALVCEDCAKMLSHLIGCSLGTARLIESLSRSETRPERLRFTAQALCESRELLPRFIVYQLGKELKTLRSLNLASAG
jgi:DNA repair protein RecO (recombination protein O)